MIRNLRADFMPASFTALVKIVPTAVGPSGVFVISCTRGLNLGSFVPAARKANTSSTGRLTSVVASN